MPAIRWRCAGWPDEAPLRRRPALPLAPARAPGAAALAALAPGAGVPGAGAGAGGHLPRWRAESAVGGLAGGGAPAADRLRGPPGPGRRQPAEHRARPGPGAAPAHHPPHRRPRSELGLAPPTPPDLARPDWIRGATGREPPWRNGDDGQSLLRRTTADGHRLEFGLHVLGWEQRPRVAWVTLGVLLLLTALAYLYVRRLLRPLDDIRAGGLRFGAGAVAHPSPPGPAAHSRPGGGRRPPPRRAGGGAPALGRGRFGPPHPRPRGAQARRAGATGRHHQHH